MSSTAGRPRPGRPPAEPIPSFSARSPNLLRFFIVAIVLACGLPRAAAQPDPDYIFSAPDVIATPAESNVRVEIRIDTINGLPVEAWSYGVCHDGAELSLGGSGAPSASLNEVLSLNEFLIGPTPAGNVSGIAMPLIFPQFATDVVYDDGPGGAQDGFTTAVILFTSPPVPLPPVENALINIVFYDAVGPSGTVADLEFCDGLGPAPVSINVTVGQIPITPTVDDGSITIANVATFARGDCNESGDVDLADAIAGLQVLTGGPSLTSCLDTCDANGDGLLSIVDPIALLSFLFLDGPAPSVPFASCTSKPLFTNPICGYPSALCP